MAGGPSSPDAPALTMFMATITTLKGMIGAGLLGLPLCFGSVGLAVSLPGSILIAIINALGAWRLVETKIHLQRNHTGYTSGSDTDVDSALDSENTDKFSDILEDNMEDSMKDCGLGPIAAVGNRLIGVGGIVLAGIAVLGTQLGISLAYVVTIQATLLDMPWTRDQDPLTLRIVACVIFCMLSLIRKLGSLAKLSMVALGIYCFVVLDLVVVGWSDVMSGANIPLQQAFGEIHMDKVESWFGSSVFAFEGIVLAQYVFDDMKLGSDMKPFGRVLMIAYVVAWVVFAFVGAYGFLAFGPTVKAPFYLAFPKGHVDTIMDKLSLVLVLFQTFALQMFPVFSFFDYLAVHQEHAGLDIQSDSGYDEKEANWRPHHSRGKKILDITIRFSVTILLCVIGSILPKVSCVTDLVGAVFMSLMGFVLPGIFHFLAFKGEHTKTSVIIDTLLVVVGLTSLLLGVTSAPSCFAGE